MKIQKLIIVLFIGLITGCAGNLLKPVPILAKDKVALQASGPITVTMQKTPGFLFQTPAGALVGAGMARWSEPGKAPSWRRITDLHNIPDFTETIRNEFIGGLMKIDNSYRFALANIREPYSVEENFTYVKKYTTPYVLEIRSQFGSFSYGPLSWKTHFLNYTGQARIIRTSDQQLIWNATCTISSADNSLLEVPAEDFLVKDGHQFKAATAYATNSCTRQLIDSFMKSS